MKLIVLVPSPEYLNNAGARIRYDRIAPRLAERGVELTMQEIGGFAPDTTGADVVIVSKCHDPVAIVVAAMLAGRGILVGVDLFDDYFSRPEDSRMARYRTWLSQMLAECDFALCSTEAMAAVARTYRPDIAAHVMNDPAPEPAIDLSAVLGRKLREVQERRSMTVAWFGVGDNPHFPVGLRDIANFNGALQELGRSGLDVGLRVLTNRRALGPQGLELLANLPLRTSIAEWSEEREIELLERAFAVFLPVNSQPFSKAKSLNRAITALSFGCQVLSVGHPLYEKLDPLIYRDADELIGDLEQGTMRLSPKRMTTYRRLMKKFASPEGEASAFVDFLSKFRRRKPDTSPLVVLHGHSTSGAAHKLVQRLGGLSVASPACRTGLGFDVVFKATATGLSMEVSEKAVQRVKPKGGKLARIADAAASGWLEPTDDRAIAAHRAIKMPDVSLPLQLASYRGWLEEMRDRMTATFGPCRFIISEMSNLPFSPGEPAAA